MRIKARDTQCQSACRLQEVFVRLHTDAGVFRHPGICTLRKLLRRDDFPALICTAVGTYSVRHLRLAALRTGRHGRLLEEVMRSAHISSRPGMSFYWIWHFNYPLFVSFFLTLKFFSTARRASIASSRQLHETVLRFVPQCGHSPRHS